jgi:hypothetical protein
MTNFQYVNKKTKVFNSITITITKRTLFRFGSKSITRYAVGHGHSAEKISPTSYLQKTNTSTLMQSRSYAPPDQGYIAVKTDSVVVGKDPQTGNNVYESNVVTATGQQLPLHEQSHTIIRDNETGKDVGVLTSAKNPNKGNLKIAEENYKGEPKAQFFRAFDQPRDSTTSTNVAEDVKITQYLKKHENALNDVVKKANNYIKPSIARFDKDSPQLYYENGLPIFDKNGKEIDYD